MLSNDKDFELARIFLNHSLSLKSREKLLISTTGSGAFPLVKALYIEALKMGVYPQLDTDMEFFSHRAQEGGFSYQFYKHANKWQLSHVPVEILNAKIDWADAYVRIVSPGNLRELTQIDPKLMTDRAKIVRPYVDKMIDSDRWVLTYYPNEFMAQDAGVSTDWLVDFYYDCVLVDYKDMKKKLLKLQGILDKGSRVHVVGRDTDITFSIEGRLSQACYGERNIPDGEVFLAPVHDSLEGEIYFDMPSIKMSREVRGVRLEFEKGKVVNAIAEYGNDTLQKVLDTDRGSRYVGEFAIGANYNIKDPMRNTLFDEKIGGTIHMALGRAYKEKRGGGENQSAVHWDIVKDMRNKGDFVKVDGNAVLQDGKIQA